MEAKDRFINFPARREWEGIAKSDTFKVACDYAMLEFVQRQNRGNNLNESWDNNSKLIGAREFLDILKALHEPETERKPYKGEELGYNAVPDFSGAPKL